MTTTAELYTLGFDPVAGNEAFADVRNVANQTKSLIIGDELSGDTFTTDKLTVPVISQNFGTGGSIQQFIAYAPTEFATLASGGPKLYFNRKPGQPQALSADDPNLVVLPICHVLECRITNNGTPLTLSAGTTFVIGTDNTPAVFPSLPGLLTGEQFVRYTVTSGACLAGGGMLLGGGNTAAVSGKAPFGLGPTTATNSCIRRGRQ